MSLPVGKLPPELLAEIIKHVPIDDGRVLLGPGIGLDCAVVEHGEKLLVYKTDPITFTADQIGWYAVQINANDIATTGAEPRGSWRHFCYRRIPPRRTRYAKSSTRSIAPAMSWASP